MTRLKTFAFVFLSLSVSISDARGQSHSPTQTPSPTAPTQHVLTQEFLDNLNSTEGADWSEEPRTAENIARIRRLLLTVLKPLVNELAAH